MPKNTAFNAPGSLYRRVHGIVRAPLVCTAKWDW
jgi:hypothetical protein